MLSIWENHTWMCVDLQISTNTFFIVIVTSFKILVYRSRHPGDLLAIWISPILVLFLLMLIYLCTQDLYFSTTRSFGLSYMKIRSKSWFKVLAILLAPIINISIVCSWLPPIDCFAAEGRQEDKNWATMKSKCDHRQEEIHYSCSPNILTSVW